jgi:UDP-N-acetylmuramyl pentapeptide phosphotransferase/UDP-N-acetylglucosamine-1-phosphate transferase
MSPITNIIGIILIIFGVLALGYQGITYTQHEKIAQIGDVQLTQNTQKSIDIPPLAGGLALIAGIALVVVARTGKK